MAACGWEPSLSFFRYKQSSGANSQYWIDGCFAQMLVEKGSGALKAHQGQNSGKSVRWSAVPAPCLSMFWLKLREEAGHMRSFLPPVLPPPASPSEIRVRKQEKLTWKMTFLALKTRIHNEFKIPMKHFTLIKHSFKNFISWPDTRLSQSRLDGQGQWWRSLGHLGKSGELKTLKNEKKSK